MDRTWLLPLALGVVGCSGAGPPPKPMPLSPPPPPVSSAELRLIDLQDGQDAPLVAGAQGGFHVWLQYAVRDLPPGTITLERSAHRLSDGAVVLRYTGEIAVGAPAADGWSTAPAPIPMFMCPTPIGISVVDTPIDFALRALDADGGELAHTGVTLVPRCPDAQRDVCTRICTG